MRLGSVLKGRKWGIEKVGLSLVRKDEKIGELQIWLGKQFQTVGAEIEKEPLVKRRLVWGTL